MQVDIVGGGGHTWPHDGRSPLNATEEMASFFSLRTP
jgi:hypothetical protein